MIAFSDRLDCLPSLPTSLPSSGDSSPLRAAVQHDQRQGTHDLAFSFSGGYYSPFLSGVKRKLPAAPGDATFPVLPENPGPQPAVVNYGECAGRIRHPGGPFCIWRDDKKVGRQDTYLLKGVPLFGREPTGRPPGA